MASTTVVRYQGNPYSPDTRRRIQRPRNIINARTAYAGFKHIPGGTVQYWRQQQRINLYHRMRSPYVKSLYTVKRTAYRNAARIAYNPTANKAYASYIRGANKSVNFWRKPVGKPVAGFPHGIPRGSYAIVYGGAAVTGAAIGYGGYKYYKHVKKIRAIKRRRYNAQVVHHYKNTPPQLTRAQRQQIARRRRRVHGRFA